MCNWCHDVLMMSLKQSNLAILNINGVDYRCIVNGTSKSESVNLLWKVDLNGKNGTLQNIKTFYNM